MYLSDIDTEQSVGILMPSRVDADKFHLRYRGLEKELGLLGVRASFSFGHASYDPTKHRFISSTDSSLNAYPDSDTAHPHVVRDLTMPKSDGQPIYLDPYAPKIVHHPTFSSFVRDKSNIANLLPEIQPETIVALREDVIEAAAAICSNLVVVKPAIGERSQGIFIGEKNNIPDNLEAPRYLIQEYIDTSSGVPELNIHSVHNIRVLSINGELVGAIGRINDASGRFLHGQENDKYGYVYLPEQLPTTMLEIAEKVNKQLKQLPGDGKNVVAIDLMRGFNSAGDEVDVLCEVNRRPLRVSRYDLHKPQIDPKGIKWLGDEWDNQEAQMLMSTITDRSITSEQE